jgi:hypothetical protein
MGLVAFGYLAFSLDVGSLFRQRRMAQAAADAAAVAAAGEIAGGYSDAQTVANAVAKLNGFDTTLATNPATVTLSTPTTGNFIGSNYVVATVSKPVSTPFLYAFSHTKSTLTVAAQAIAGGGVQSQTCVCLEGGSGDDLQMSNNSKLTATGCGVVSNSSSGNAITVVGSANINALSIASPSTTWDSSSNINNGGSVTSSHIVQGLTTKCSPTLPAVPAYSSCSSDPGGSSSSFTAGPASASGVACYTSLTVGANGSADTLNPGTYVIKGGTLHFESGSSNKSNLGGQGVFFYLTAGASLVIDNGANVNLVAGGNTESGGGTAPSVGAYNGVLFFQDTSDASTMNVQGGSSAYLNGAIMAPAAQISLGNGSGSVVDGGIVANTLVMTGGGTLNASAGTTNDGSVTVGGNAKLVQ